MKHDDHVTLNITKQQTVALRTIICGVPPDDWTNLCNILTEPTPAEIWVTQDVHLAIKKEGNKFIPYLYGCKEDIRNVLARIGTEDKMIFFRTQEAKRRWAWAGVVVIAVLFTVITGELTNHVSRNFFFPCLFAYVGTFFWYTWRYRDVM